MFLGDIQNNYRLLEAMNVFLLPAGTFFPFVLISYLSFVLIIYACRLHDLVCGPL